MSLSFVVSHMYVLVCCHLEASGSCQRWFPLAGYHREFEFSKTLMFAVEVTCKYDVVPPQTEPLNDFTRGPLFGTVQC